MAGSFQLQMTEAQFETAQAQAQEHGLKLSPFGGTLPPQAGVYLNYSIAKTNNLVTATVEVVKHPFFVTTGMIENHVRQLLGL